MVAGWGSLAGRIRDKPIMSQLSGTVSGGIRGSKLDRGMAD